MKRNTRTHRILLLVMLSLIINSGFGQVATPVGLSQTAFDSLVQKGFTQVVTGQSEVPTLTNYAAFAPADSKFTFNGFTNIGQYMAVSISASGGLIDDNVGGLFSGGRLNKNSDIKGRLHFRASAPSLRYDARDYQLLRKKVEKLNSEQRIKLATIYNNLDAIPIELRMFRLKIDTANRIIRKLVADSTGLARRGFNRCAGVSAEKCMREIMDSLTSANTAIIKERKQILQLQYKRDSLLFLDSLNSLSSIPNPSLRQRYLITTFGYGATTFRDSLREEIERANRKKILALEMGIPIPAWNISWFTIITHWNRQIYRTYGATLPFADQIKKHDFDAFNFGIEYNRFHSDRLFRRVNYSSVSLTRNKKINLDELSTSKVTDESTQSSGTINRKAATEYTVYTDSIEMYRSWDITGDFYQTIGSKMSMGFHLFGEAEIRDSGREVYAAGLGFFFGFNNKADKRVVNTELSLRFNDITDELDEDGISFYKQIDINLSIAVPLLFIRP
jgi:hypothetical protein